MRVAVDTKILDNPYHGVARYVSGLLAGLEALGPSDLELELLAPRRGGSTLLWTVWGLARASRRGYDLLHCPFYYAPLRPGCPVTVAIHDVLVLTHPEWFPRPWANPIRWLAPRAARRAQGIVTFSRAAAEEIEALCRVPRERIRVIPHGVDGRIFRPPPEEVKTRARRRWAGGRPYLVQVGALEPRRGVDLALCAVEALRRHRPELVFVLVGSERAPTPELENAPPWVIRPGRVADEELPALYAAAEAVLAPSRGEGFDLPVLEALACGAVVVASDIPVHVEHFAPAVRLFAFGDWEALAEALVEVLEDGELRRALRTRAIRHAEGFTWERSAREHLALWREIVGP